MLPSNGHIDVYTTDEKDLTFREISCGVTVAIGIILGLVMSPAFTLSLERSLLLSVAFDILLALTLSFWFATPHITEAGTNVGIIVCLAVIEMETWLVRGVLPQKDGTLASLAIVLLAVIIVGTSVSGKVSNMRTLFQRTNQSYHRIRRWASYVTHPVAWGVAAIGGRHDAMDSRYVLVDGEYNDGEKRSHRFFAFDLKEMTITSLPDDESQRQSAIDVLTSKVVPEAHDTEGVIPASRIPRYDGKFVWLDPQPEEPTRDEYYDRL